MAKGLADELADRGYLVVDGLDGKGRYALLPPGAELARVPLGAVVSLQSMVAKPRAADAAIAAVAEAQIYAPDRHLIVAQADARSGRDPGDFVQAHVRRLEALRRAGIVERLGDGRWRLPNDFLAQAAGHEAGRFGAVRVEVLSEGGVSQQARLLGVTWLDRALIDDARPAMSGFGAEVRQALDGRRVYLTEQGLAEDRNGRWRAAPKLLATLQAREIESAGARLARETGLEHRLVADGTVVRGTYRRSINLVSGRFALIDDGLGFSLVPWRPVLENRIGQTVSGMARAAGVDWTLGRSQGR